MNLEEFQNKVEENLIQRLGEIKAKKLMRIYEEDIKSLYEQEIGIVATATAIIMGY